MVATSNRIVSRVGLDVLDAGGNAVDAAVAMSFASGVVEPGSSGIGGGGMMLVHDARAGTTTAIDFAMDAPRAAVPGCFALEEGKGSDRFGWRKVANDANAIGYRSAAIPGLVRGLALALERFGTLPLSDLLAPAIRLAGEGFGVGLQAGLAITRAMHLLRRFPASAEIFLPGGLPLQSSDGHRPADVLIQRDLAHTLRLIAGEGPDAFYAGPIARAIAEAMDGHEGLIALDDLRDYRPAVVDPQRTSYRGQSILGVPGSCGCITAQQSLNILEMFELGAYASDAPELLHLRIEAFRLAFADRWSLVADPKQARVPWAGLLSKEYAAARHAEIDPRHAARRVGAGDPWAFDRGTSTTHICAADSERNVVTLTQSLVDSFGSGAVVPGTGVLLNNAMLWLDPEPGRPNSVAPGKRGLNNMTPLMVLKDGKPLLALGSPGGVRIINAVTQVISNVLDHGLGVQDAIDAPRVDASGETALIDSRFDEDVFDRLEEMGHAVAAVEETAGAAHYSKPVGIYVDPGSGRLEGGADSLRGSVALGR